jgi:adenylate kinase
MADEAIRLRLVKHRDQLRTLPVKKQKRLQTLAATKISREKGDAVFVDTHLFIRTREGYWPGLPFEVAKALKPTHLLLVEADPEEIAKRRSMDKTRSRDELSEDDLAAELALGRSFLATVSVITGAPMLVVANHEGKSEGAALSVASILSDVMKQ